MNKAECKVLRKVTELRSIRESYKVCKYDNYYVAVNVKYIDENGAITKPLNGIEMCASDTVQECIQNTLVRDIGLYFVDEGYEPIDVVMSIYEAENMFDMTEIRDILERRISDRCYRESAGEWN